MFSWKKKAQEADKALKPESATFKDPGEKEKLIVNPKQEQFPVGSSVQQHIEKIDIPISEAQKIPASEVKKYTKAQLEKAAAESKGVDAESTQYKAKGEAGKLQYPTKQDIFPANVKQPGLSSGEDAGSKTYKDSGKVEKLDIPTKPATLPEGGMVVSTDAKAGAEFKPAGEKEKLILKPKEFKGAPGQPASDVSPTDYMHKYDTAKPIQKQFGKINWFKRDSKAGLSMEVADIIIKAAIECPSCFNKVVAYVNSIRKQATVTREELDAFWKGKGVTLTPEVLDQQLAAVVTSTSGATTTPSMPGMPGLTSTLKDKEACNEMEEHEKRHHGKPEEVTEVPEVVEDETPKALEEMSKI